jgi:hypothetical protein
VLRLTKDESGKGCVEQEEEGGQGEELSGGRVAQGVDRARQGLSEERVV